MSVHLPILMGVPLPCAQAPGRFACAHLLPQAPAVDKGAVSTLQVLNRKGRRRASTRHVDDSRVLPADLESHGAKEGKVGGPATTAAGQTALPPRRTSSSFTTMCTASSCLPRDAPWCVTACMP